jgi:hypothetical protein
MNINVDMKKLQQVKPRENKLNVNHACLHSQKKKNFRKAKKKDDKNNKEK